MICQKKVSERKGQTQYVHTHTNKEKQNKTNVGKRMDGKREKQKQIRIFFTLFVCVSRRGGGSEVESLFFSFSSPPPPP